MRKIGATAMMICLLAGPAYSQGGHSKQDDGANASKTLLQLEQEEEKRRAKDVDAQYERAMKRSRATTPNVASDPWQNVRPGASGDRK